MYEQVLLRMREKVRSRQYVMTLHADDEMDEDGLSIYDVEQTVLTGEVVEQQRDRDTAEWKYCVRGLSLAGSELEVVAKLSPTGKLVIITVYLV